MKYFKPKVIIDVENKVETINITTKSPIKNEKLTTELIERNQLLKLLYKPIAKVKGLSIEYINKVNEKYPIYIKIIDLVSEFRIILKSNN